MKQKLLPFLLCILVTCMFASCESSTTPGAAQYDTTIVNPTDRAVFVVNEGGGAGQSSLDALVFRSSQKDSSHRLGIVSGMGEGNDVRILGNRAYVVDNGSNQVVVVNADSLKQITTIPMGVNGPNKIAQIGPTKLVVTQRASPQAAIIDASSNVVTDSIPVGMNAAAVGVLNNRVFITTSVYLQPGTIQMIDLTNRNVLKTLNVVSSPEMLAVDSINDQIIVGCDGDYNTVPPVVYFIDANSMAIRDSVIVGPAGTAFSMVLGDRLYLVEGNTVQAVNLTSHTVSGLVNSSPNTYYNGAYDPVNHQLYLGRSNFTSSGTVDVLDALTGTIKWSFPAGIAPAHFAFYH